MKPSLLRKLFFVIPVITLETASSPTNATSSSRANSPTGMCNASLVVIAVRRIILFEMAFESRRLETKALDHIAGSRDSGRHSRGSANFFLTKLWRWPSKFENFSGLGERIS